MKIEVLLTDKVNENIDNYDENRNLFEANQFKAKKNQMLYMSKLNSTEDSVTLIVGTDGCESEYDFVDLGASIGKKINNDGFENYHSLPLEQSYKSLIKSNLADMKNTGGRFGGAITAALLLEEFVDNLNWIHLDIAGPARSRSSNSIYPEGGTGFGVLGYFNFLTNEANS